MFHYHSNNAANTLEHTLGVSSSNSISASRTNTLSQTEDEIDDKVNIHITLNKKLGNYCDKEISREICKDLLINLNHSSSQALVLDNQYDGFDKYDEDTYDENWIAEEEKGTISMDSISVYGATDPADYNQFRQEVEDVRLLMTRTWLLGGDWNVVLYNS
ncbi:hypothetical protein MKW98_022432 [Papaver atlanticum]|uniref:Uncharacterized protein n=1 Tax=Papaver atlanticum TaxID=357466 RepID=A0AAD4X550_9MAGN|nr:hypothetical protein MKW98_022432 [Papaver atlanticum]